MFEDNPTYKIEPESNMLLNFKTTWGSFKVCNFAVSLEGFATVHRAATFTSISLTIFKCIIKLKQNEYE